MTKFSRLLALVLVVALMANFVVPGLAVNASEGCQCDPATRTGTYLETIAATCVDYGYDVYECDDCGKQYSQNLVLPTGHDLVEVEAQAQTCTESGWNAYEYCTKCDYTTYDEIEADGHAHELVEDVDSDCINSGYKTYTCHCGDTYSVPVDAKGHTAGDVVVENRVEANCTEDGSYDNVVYCTVCGDELSRKTVVIPANGHTAGKCAIENLVGATCTDGGSYDEVTYCDVCREVISRIPVVVPALGHNPGEAVMENYEDNSCTEDGYYEMVVYCTVCGEELSREGFVMPAYKHYYGYGPDYVLEATCTEPKTEVYICLVCEFNLEKPVGDPLGHNYEAVVTDPTCTEEGYTTHTCDRCDDVYVDSYVDALGHNYEAVVTDPTCTEEGYTTHTCANCGDVYVDTYVEATGHTYEAVVTAPTCIEEGYTTYTCHCGESYVDDVTPIDPYAHNHGITKPYQAPTCVADGWTAEVACFYCGHVLAGSEVIPADPNAHDLVKVDAKAPTCTEIGWDEYEYCTRCNYSTYDEIEALGHVEYDVIENYVGPTCTEDGSYDVVYYCDRCEEELSREPVTIEALGHSGNRCVIEDLIGATCTEEGSYNEVTYCDVCREAYIVVPVVVPALGHNYEAVVTAPTCTEQGYTTYTCIVCGDVYVADYVDALGHAEYGSRGYVNPTCTENGYWIAKCYTCGTFLIEDKDSALGHNYVGVVTAPTCTEQGYTTFTCHNHIDVDDDGIDVECGDTYVADYVDALGHTAGKCAIENLIGATCDKEGSYDEVTYCDVCREVISVIPVVVPAMGHNPSEIVIENTVEPTCDVDGSYDEVTYCTACGIELSRNTVVVPAVGHTYEAVVTAPTCTEQGYTTYTCHCGDSYVADYVDALGHTLGRCVIENLIGATCTEEGSYDEVTYCDVCREAVIVTPVVVPALGHLVVDATCTEDGYCERCQAVLEDALGHDVVIVPGYDATYDATGLTDGQICGRCGEVLVEQTVIAPLSEEITFSYKAYGINGVANAVNSGYITVEIWMNVNSDIARLWGLELDLQFSESLTLQGVYGCIFEQLAYTPLNIANADNAVKLTQDMSYDADKTFAQGEYLFATLEFKVDKDYYSQDAAFIVNLDDCAIARGEFANELNVDFGEGTQIHVNMLGDANLDGKITSADTMALSQWFAESGRGAYETIYDMNKDGYVDGDDFALLRGAVVRDNSYLDI